MSDSIFLNDIITELYGSIPDDALEKVRLAISKALTNYDVTEKQTAVMVYKSLPEAVKIYLVTKGIEGRSEGTLYLYRLYLEDFFHAFNMPIEKITANEIRVYLYGTKKNRSISDISLDSRRRVIRSFFTWCHNEGYISRNPCLQIPPIKVEKKPRNPYTDIQMENMRDSCRTDREKAIIETLYSTGCRVSELVGIKVSDIDFTTREVKLYGKGKKHRVSFINARAEIALKRYLQNKTVDTEYVFTSRKKPYNKIGKATIEKEVRKIGERAGVDRAIPHRFRHTTATNAIDHGMDVSELKTMLGHEKLDTTMIYTKINNENVASSHRKYIL